MKQKRTTACRVWMGMAIMLATALGVRAQGNITLKLIDEPLPKALQLIEHYCRESQTNLIYVTHYEEEIPQCVHLRKIIQRH